MQSISGVETPPVMVWNKMDTEAVPFVTVYVS
jgi:hypothetical protein